MNLMTLRRSSFLGVLMTTALVSAALAADAPKRKSGLWETTIQTQGMPNMGPMQQCVDQANDDIMRRPDSGQKSECSVMEVKPSAGKVVIHSVCKADGTTVTTDAVFAGSFDSSYKGEIVARFSPPMRGMSETKMNIAANWKGACKPGQRPGEMSMPKMDMEALMKDPKMMELMKQQK